MKSGLIMTCPSHDLATSYLSTFSLDIPKLCSEKSIKYKVIYDKEVTKKNTLKVIMKLDYNFILFNGHGDTDCITGHSLEPLIEFGKDELSLKNRIVYARSCWAASKLGHSCVNNNNGCFIGYTIPFIFLHDKTRSSTPKKDKIAKPFIDTTNLIPQLLLKGKTVNYANEISKKAMLKEMKKLLSYPEDGRMEVLWNNYMAQVVLGNGDMTVV